MILASRSHPAGSKKIFMRGDIRVVQYGTYMVLTVYGTYRISPYGTYRIWYLPYMVLIW